MNKKKSRFAIRVNPPLSALSALITAVMIIGVLGFGGSVRAADYYVSPTITSTDWAAAQNINMPCTPQTAMANAVAGDTVYFRGGTYVLPFITLPSCTARWRTGLIAPSHSGTTENPITFMAYPEEIPFLDNSANEGQCNVIASFGTDGQDYIIFDGLHTKVVLSAGDYPGCGRGAQLHNSEYCIVRNCDIEGSLNGLTNNSPVRLEHATYCTVENNKLYNSKQSGGYHHNSCGFMSYHADYVIVQNNDIWNCDAGIFDKRYGDNNTYRYNHIWNCAIGFDVGTKFEANEGIEVYQNIMRGITGSWSIFIVAIDSGTADKFKFYNNTLYDVALGISLNESPAITNAEIFNNIIHTRSGAYGVGTFTGAASLIDYNDYYNVNSWVMNLYLPAQAKYYTLNDWQTGTGFDLNSIVSDPQFVNAGGTNPEDYKLQSSSLALTLGIDRQDYDNDGNTTETISAGAYIIGNEIIGYTDSGAPDTTPPSRSNPQPAGTLSSGTISTTISLTTDETAVCKYSDVANITYDNMTGVFATTNSTNHLTNITNLVDGNSYTYYVKCQDESNNQNTDDFEISFSIASSTTYSISNFINLVSDWLKTESGLTSDVNGDGVVNTRDLGVMMSNWQN